MADDPSVHNADSNANINAGSADNSSGGFDDWWILIPLAALSIPILAVSPWMAAALGVVALVAAVTVAAKILMNHRHKLRLQELAMREKIATLEASQLESANRVLEQNAQMRDLREAVAAQESQPVQPRQSQPVQDT